MQPGDPFSDPFTGEESGRSIIELRGISRCFGSQDVLRNVSLDIRAGETVCLIGESGCGKSVTMKIMASLMQPTAGKVLWNDVPIKDRTDE